MNPIPTWRDTLGNSPTLIAAGAVGEAMQAEIDALRTRLAEVEKDADDVGEDCTPNHMCNGRMVHLPSNEQCDKCGEQS